MSKSARGRGTEELSLFSVKSGLCSPLAFVRDPGPVPLSPNLVPELHLGHGDESEKSHLYFWLVLRGSLRRALK